jgi:hypothetical protein
LTTRKYKGKCVSVYFRDKEAVRLEKLKGYYTTSTYGYIAIKEKMERDERQKGASSMIGAAPMEVNNS